MAKIPTSLTASGTRVGNPSWCFGLRLLARELAVRWVVYDKSVGREGEEQLRYDEDLDLRYWSVSSGWSLNENEFRRGPLTTQLIHVPTHR